MWPNKAIIALILIAVIGISAGYLIIQQGSGPPEASKPPPKEPPPKKPPQEKPPASEEKPMPGGEQEEKGKEERPTGGSAGGQEEATGEEGPSTEEQPAEEEQPPEQQPEEGGQAEEGPTEGQQPEERPEVEEQVYTLSGRWEQIGPDGGDMHFVYITKDHILFLSHGFGGFWRSEDRGDNWEFLYHPEWIDMAVLAMAESKGMLLAGGNCGLWLSIDEGKHWERLVTGNPDIDSCPSNYEILSIEIGKDGTIYFSGRIYKLALDSGFRGNPSGFFRLRNNTLEFVPMPTDADIEASVRLEYSPDFKGREVLFVSNDQAGLYLYDLEREEWEGPLLTVGTLQVYAEEGKVYVGTVGDWYYIGSYDSGWSWEHLTIPNAKCSKATFILPDPYNPDRLWLGARAKDIYHTKGASFLAIGVWKDGKWKSLKFPSRNFAESIAIDRHGEGENPEDFMVLLPDGPIARYAFVPQGGGNSLMRTEDGGVTWERAYNGVYGDTINDITYIEEGVRAGDVVVTCVSGTQIWHEGEWVEGFDYTIGDVGYGLPGYAWGAASPPQKIEGRYDLLVATGYPPEDFVGNGVYAIDVEGIVNREEGAIKRLVEGPVHDILVVDGLLYVGRMDEGVWVYDLESGEARELEGLPPGEAGINLAYENGTVYISTIKGGNHNMDNYFFTDVRATGGIYMLKNGSLAQIYHGERAIAFSVHEDEMLVLTVRGRLLYYRDGQVEAICRLPDAIYSDMVVDWDRRIIYLSTFDSINPGVLYGWLDGLDQGFQPLGEGLMTNRVRCLELVGHTLYAGTEGHSVWIITPEIAQ